MTTSRIEPATGGLAECVRRGARGHYLAIPVFGSREELVASRDLSAVLILALRQDAPGEPFFACVPGADRRPYALNDMLALLSDAPGYHVWADYLAQLDDSQGTRLALHYVTTAPDARSGWLLRAVIDYAMGASDAVPDLVPLPRSAEPILALNRDWRLDRRG